MHRPNRIRTTLALACATLLASCQPQPAPPATTAPAGAPSTITAGPLVAVDLSDARALPTRPDLASARNETISLAVRVTPPDAVRARKKLSLRLSPFKTPDGQTLDPTHVTAYQVLPMPADTSRAAYVRHTGLETTRTQLPSALIPLAIGSDGSIPLAQLRLGDDLTKPGDKEKGIPQPVTLFFDLHVPAEQPAGQYAATLDFIEDQWGKRALASLPVRLAVDDFVLPDNRHLLMVSRLEWDTLYRHWPKEFEAITPRLLNRDEQRHAGAVRVLDQIIRTAQRNRVQVVVPRLQPTAKWPAAAPPQFDWIDFDSVVAPWLTGDAFPDKTPYGYWPLPPVDGLDRFDRASRMEYWQAVATHFDQKDWLPQSTVLLDVVPSASEERRQRDTTAEAAEILKAHTRVRVAAPVPFQTLDAVERREPGRVDFATAARLAVWGPGLVHAPRTRAWPASVEQPARFLAAAMPSTPYLGAGATQRDVRQWAWLAYLQRAGMILWPETLPKSDRPTTPAAAGETIWLYPGHWFGLAQPVETLQLKHARRAAQDYEYLWLAQQRGQVVSPEIIARLLSKPVELRTGQPADPVYTLMSGTVDQQTWDDARRLVARAVLLTAAGEQPDPVRSEELRLETFRWTVAESRPTALVRDIRWVPSRDANWVDVRLGLDLYSPAADPADKNTLEWAAAPAGWQVTPRPIDVPKLAANQVRRVELDARFNLDQAGPPTTRDTRLDFISGYTGSRTPARFVLPVAHSQRREGALRLDGDLADWNDLDAIHSGPLVRMLSQPALRAPADADLPRAATPSSLYTAWSEDAFYVAFKLAGVTATDRSVARNFVEYQDRRAWGEDLIEVLAQAVYEGGATGPIVHIICKPTGGTWVERKSAGDADWTTGIAGAGVLYAGRVEPTQNDPASTWRGELAIPFKILGDTRFGRPKFLRLNVAQHKSATGESSSWAGPTDHARDDSLTGLLLLHDTTR